MQSIPQGGCIYTITNTVNGKVYVGQTIMSPVKRWQRHTYCLRHGTHGNPHLQSAWTAYGEHAFVFAVVETFGSVEETNAAECRYIAHFRSVGIELYNMRAGGANGKPSAETRARQSAAHKGKPGRIKSETERAWMRGRKMSAESSAKTRAANIGRAVSEETRAKLRAANIGKKYPADVRARMGAAKRGRPGRKQSQDEKDASRARKLGTKHSAATKAKMSASQRRRATGEESRARMSIAQRSRHQKNYIFKSPAGATVYAQILTVFARDYGLQISNVSHLVLGRRKTHKGWSFVGFGEAIVDPHEQLSS